jgi:hypothetical protein
MSLKDFLFSNKSKTIKSIVFPGEGSPSSRTIHKSDTIKLQLCAEYYKNFEILWVNVFYNGIEKERHNVQFLESIYWDV